MAQEKVYGTGRRKTSVARVYLVPGTGKILVNRQPINEYFRRKTLELIVRQPLEEINGLDKFDVEAYVNGGGWSGQAGAVRMGIARCLVKSDERNKKSLRAAGFLTPMRVRLSVKPTVTKKPAKAFSSQTLIRSSLFTAYQAAPCRSGFFYAA
jgi:small subunit ribosomal protein S9